MTWQQRIDVDPAICAGCAYITGNRIPISSMLENRAEGVTLDAIVAVYQQSLGGAPDGT